MKQTLLFRGPVKTVSGYGSHSRDLLECLYRMNKYEIYVDSCAWGYTPLTALEPNNEFHKWIESRIVTTLETMPDIYVQVTIPSEFMRLGKFNIGITAGIETTVAPRDWILGCNKMDLIITTSNFSKEVLTKTAYNEVDKNTSKIIKQHRVEKPVVVLFEGVDTVIYNNKESNFNLDIKEDFAFLFVGHWLRGDLGQDRKDVGMLIRCFVEAHRNEPNPPALILKTSSATFSIIEREQFRQKIESIVGSTNGAPPIYLLFGQLTDEEMNGLYNHPKVKSMVSITKGEGFGRPLLEFSMTGKPIIASNWSGHLDFLNLEHSILIGGELKEVHESATDSFIIKDAKWFTANYNEFIAALKILREKYFNFLQKSEKLRKINKDKFSKEKMTEEFENILGNDNISKEVKLNLPMLEKIN